MRAPTVSYSMAGASPATASVVLPIDRRGYFLHALALDTLRATTVGGASTEHTGLIELLDGEGGVTQSFAAEFVSSGAASNETRFDFRVGATSPMSPKKIDIFGDISLTPSGGKTYLRGELPPGLWIEPGQRVRVSLPGANDTSLGASYADQWRKIHVVLSYP